MKIIRRAEVVKSLFDYVDGNKTIGQCIDDCQTLDGDELIAEIDSIKDVIDRQEWGYRLDALERLQMLKDKLEKWGCSDERLL